MKKFLIILTLFFGLIFLGACDELKREELDLTPEQVGDLFEGIEFDKVTDDIIQLNANIDVKMNIVASDVPYYEEDVELVFEVKGKLDVYANLKTYEDLYVYVNVDLTFEVDPGPLADDDDAEFDAMKGFVKGKAYLVDGNLYVKGSYKVGNEEVEMENKILDVVNEEQYLELKDNLANVGGFAMIPEMLPFKVYQVGESHEIEFSFGDDRIDELIAALELALVEISEEENVEASLNKKTSFKNTVSLRFSDRLEKFVITSKNNLVIDVVIEIEEADEDVTAVISFVTDVSITLNFKGKMPTNLPAIEDLNEYPDFIPDFE